LNFNAPQLCCGVVYLGFVIRNLGFKMKPVGQTFETDLRRLRKEVLIETYRSRGPGGQRKNKTETAVRLKHLPSGITVIATEHRSQAQNRKLAFERLRERLLKLNRPRRRRIPTRIPLGAMERKKEEKTVHSVRKQLRRKSQKEWNGWE
jgi:protein subunit release factor B